VNAGVGLSLERKKGWGKFSKFICGKLSLLTASDGFNPVYARFVKVASHWVLLDNGYV
jgi:hypothetical protein